MQPALWLAEGELTSNYHQVGETKANSSQQGQLLSNQILAIIYLDAVSMLICKQISFLWLQINFCMEGRQAGSEITPPEAHMSWLGCLLSPCFFVHSPSFVHISWTRTARCAQQAYILCPKAAAEAPHIFNRCVTSSRYWAQGR